MNPLATTGPDTARTPAAPGTEPSAQGRGAPRKLAPGRFLLGLLIVALPLLLALLGPLFAGDAGDRGVSFTVGDGHWLGTDFVGRDVWRQVLLGGHSVVLVALSATVLAYAVALPIGLAAALTHRGWLEEVLMRPLDVLLAIPSLLLVLLVASVYTPGAAGLALLVALVNIPDAARIVRASAAEAASRPAVEALRMQGETWRRIAIGYVGRSMRRTLAADAGVRLTGVLYLVATAAFLGVGVEPDAADWAVMVDRNRTGLFIQPWAVVVPALLIVALSMGTNLLFDAALAPPATRRRTRRARRTALAARRATRKDRRGGGSSGSGSGGSAGRGHGSHAEGTPGPDAATGDGAQPPGAPVDAPAHDPAGACAHDPADAPAHDPPDGPAGREEKHR
ncbi:peptide/nickel transport system permease protein [Streptomyces zagrosensis]|uniref:Peptide/nickel transport system permease protein n=1 Tax=Streptomyces zagrosensis TaxID=1042984 RepID=A0A7W9QD03_9ACTN|nr:peptide/nickel transport system permease protein [Streptomyces zagrosensis]